MPLNKIQQKPDFRWIYDQNTASIVGFVQWSSQLTRLPTHSSTDLHWMLVHFCTIKNVLQTFLRNSETRQKYSWFDDTVENVNEGGLRTKVVPDMPILETDDRKKRRLDFREQT